MDYYYYYSHGWASNKKCDVNEKQQKQQQCEREKNKTKFPRRLINTFTGGITNPTRDRRQCVVECSARQPVSHHPASQLSYLYHVNINRHDRKISIKKKILCDVCAQT